jgi:hypothetical protein
MQLADGFPAETPQKPGEQTCTDAHDPDREAPILLELPSRVLAHNGPLAGPRGPNKVRRIQGISLISVGRLDSPDSLSF